MKLIMRLTVVLLAVASAGCQLCLLPCSICLAASTSQLAAADPADGAPRQEIEPVLVKADVEPGQFPAR